MLKFIRILFAVAAYHDYKIWQINVKIVFLNDMLEEDVYMSQLEDFEVSGSEHKMCKLQ